jgi:ubiquitin C-terminal hydrolase
MSMFTRLSNTSRATTSYTSRGSKLTSKVAATGSSCTHELVRYPNPSIRIAKNTGVSCYVNCVLSCLFSVPAVRTMILQAQNDIETKLNHIIAYNLSNSKTGHGNKKLELLKSFTILALHYCKISLSGTTTTTTVYIYIYITGATQ